MNTNRLDQFYWNYMKDAKMWEVFRIIFMLSHGQAAVERGFSVNSKPLGENLQEKTLVASRCVYRSVKTNANHFSELSFTNTEMKCPGSKNATLVVQSNLVNCISDNHIIRFITLKL